MFPRLTSILVLSVVTCLSLAGCATAPLPEPASADSALVVLSFRYRGITDVLTVDDADLGGVTAYITRMGPNGPVEVLQHTHRKGHYFFFTNVTSGRYQISRITKTIGGGTTPLFLAKTQVGSNAYLFTDARTATVRFPADIVNRSVTNVTPRSTVFIGDFTATIVMPGWPSSPLTVRESGGQRTAEGEQSAMRFIAASFPDSRWRQRMGSAQVR